MKAFNSKIRTLFPLVAFGLLPFIMLENSVASESFPNRPVTIVVPAPPGGTTDLAARALADDLGKALGQSIVVENKGGAHGIVGAQYALKSKPDGYTLYMAFSGFHVIAPNLTSLSYDPLKDFQPVAMVYKAPEVLAIRSSFQEIKTFQDLLDYAKANPGKLNYGSAGPGSVAHVGMELLQSITGIRMTHIPYKGTGPIVVDMLGGQIDLVLVSMPPLVAHIKNGGLRPLLFTSESRQKVFPEVPTSKELGLSNFGTSSWFALYMSAKSPPKAAQKISEEVRKIIANPAFQERASALGAEATYMNTDQLGKFTAAELERWNMIIKKADIDKN
ncbi:tripartite tricarboxylate transporter substrate binding protein [Pollutimonas sp. H1-120]|uniref:Bug family tripartite tricarboxylate transporter substrate binding protein n=1 Tax=Pollutimonas sp. H1-120 TaxID=3148824 RepID=UPI003B51BD86